MPEFPSFHSVFDEVHDVAVFGGGYAGFAAARMLLSENKKVLLIDRRAALLAESGWAFPLFAGDVSKVEWRRWWDELAARGVAENGRIDGALAEIVATEWVREQRRAGRLNVLYYATPLALEGGDVTRGELLDAVLLGTKSGLRRVAARQWIDATESGELLRLFAARQGAEFGEPARLMNLSSLYFRHAAWPQMPEGRLDISLPGLRLDWQKTLWDNERCLTITATDTEVWQRAHWVPALRALREKFPQAMAEAVLTHGSVEPFEIYSRQSQKQPIPPNMATAVPWQRRDTAETFVAGRYDLGDMAARRILDLPQAQPESGAPFRGEILWREEKCDVAVAGLGTGGALATLAAARQGADVLGFDPLPFCGGIGAGGGIHWYYFGVKGGLQEQLDERQRAVAPLFAPTGQIQGFHPDAKKCVLEAMLREANARLIFGATLIGVQRVGNRVTHALLATPGGPLRLEAQAWIDSTGDGDLAAQAGAQSRFGRDGDGLVHAYSQSSGRASLKNEKAFMNVVNYDAGFVDPTDSEDLTRARLDGIVHYSREKFTSDDRTTYIAPAIGLRQSRHIVTDYTLELADLIERREFADSVGLTGCHYDNHAVDYEFESDEALLWVWVCRQWRGRIACEIPYRILLPQGLDNVWLACRALGVSQDAHHSLRMQRDMQRIGEVAGVAAALSSTGNSRDVPFEKLREALAESGALEKIEAAGDDFGPDTKGTSVTGRWGQASVPAVAEGDFTNVASQHGRHGGLPPRVPTQVDAWLTAVEIEPPSAAFDAPWHLYRAGQESAEVREKVSALLDSQNAIASWRAAAIASLWDETAAQPRLLRAIAERGVAVDSEKADKDDKYRCEVPQWLVAVSLLRRVGSPECLAALDELAGEAGLLHNARTAIALCCEGIAARHELNEAQRELVLGILWKLIEAPAPNSVAPPQRPLLQTEFGAQRVLEDWTWQIHLSVARARRALGLPPHQQAVDFLSDERALVRRSFAAVCGEVSVAPRRQIVRR